MLKIFFAVIALTGFLVLLVGGLTYLDSRPQVLATQCDYGACVGVVELPPSSEISFPENPKFLRDGTILVRYDTWDMGRVTLLYNEGMNHQSLCQVTDIGFWRNGELVKSLPVEKSNRSVIWDLLGF